MLLSSISSLALYALAGLIFITTPRQVFTDASSLQFWIFILLALFGALAGNLRGIALSTLVTILVPEDRRDRANGLVGTANGVAFLGASIFSGLVISYLGVVWMLIVAIAMTVLVILHLSTLAIPELSKKGRDEMHFMTMGAGVDLLGPWFRTGTDRGLALLFTLAGLIGLMVTLLAMRSYSYRALSANYENQNQELVEAYPASF